MTTDALITAHNGGDTAATSKLLEHLYVELRRIASRLMSRESPGHTLQTTALVNEAYLRLFGNGTVHLNDRNHFLNLAARSMRKILIDHARRKNARKRGAGAVRVTLGNTLSLEPEPAFELLALGEALEMLEVLSQRQARVIDLRYFVGFTIEETAEALGVSTKTVKNETTFAKAWLRLQLGT